jgi:hypothetical protein
MLNSISWSQFGLFIFLGLLCYYSYVLLRYWGRELRALAQGKSPWAGLSAERFDGAGPSAPAGSSASAASSAPAAPAGSSTAQASLFRDKDAEEGKSAELFKVMEKVVALLKGLITDATGTGIGREELMGRFGEVLSKFRHLKGTAYQVAIDNFLIRSCATNFSLQLTEGELAELWT